MRIVFMGTPDFSVPILTAIIGQGYEVVAVYSQPPRPAGRRGLELTKSPVHEKAEEFGIPVFTPKSLKGTEEQGVFASLEADVAIVVAYGLLLPQAILDAPRLDVTMAMPRFCRVGAVRLLFSVRSCRAIPRPA